MKKSVVLLAALAGSVAAHAAKPAGAEPTHVTVTPETLAQTPVSELLYSNFLELGYGYQVEAMMTEMLFNRSFETYTPYQPPFPRPPVRPNDCSRGLPPKANS